MLKQVSLNNWNNTAWALLCLMQKRENILLLFLNTNLIYVWFSKVKASSPAFVKYSFLVFKEYIFTFFTLIQWNSATFVQWQWIFKLPWKWRRKLIWVVCIVMIEGRVFCSSLLLCFELFGWCIGKRSCNFWCFYRRRSWTLAIDSFKFDALLKIIGWCFIFFWKHEILKLVNFFVLFYNVRTKRLFLF